MPEFIRDGTPQSQQGLTSINRRVWIARELRHHRSRVLHPTLSGSPLWVLISLLLPVGKTPNRLVAFANDTPKGREGDLFLHYRALVLFVLLVHQGLEVQR